MVARYWRMFRLSWCPNYEGVVLGFSLQRIVIMLCFWPLFLLVQSINGVALALDYLLFPAFRYVNVTAPVFVVGVPRSGTTFLHRLLAKDTRFTTTALWELVFAPSITQRYFWYALGYLDGKLGSPGRRVLMFVEKHLLGGLDGIHSTGLFDPEEDYLALMPYWGCFLLVLVVPSAELWDLGRLDQKGREEEKQRLMKAYQRFVQRHLFFHGQDRVLLSKNPSFTHWLQTLADYFPDAQFIACVRTPTESVPSQINSILIGARIFDGRDTQAYWKQQFLSMLQAYYQHIARVGDILPPQRWALSRMETLTVAPAQWVQETYEQFGWSLSAEYHAMLLDQEEKAKRWQSGHHYSLEKLGVSREELVTYFADVYDGLNYASPAPDA